MSYFQKMSLFALPNYSLHLVVIFRFNLVHSGAIRGGHNPHWVGGRAPLWSGPEAGPRGKAKKPLRSRKGVEREREREREREKKERGPLENFRAPLLPKALGLLVYPIWGDRLGGYCRGVGGLDFLVVGGPGFSLQAPGYISLSFVEANLSFQKVSCLLLSNQAISKQLNPLDHTTEFVLLTYSPPG